MKAYAYIPIKEESTRVPHKNFRYIGEMKLYQSIIQRAIQSNSFFV